MSYLGLHVFGEVALGLEAEATVSAVVGSEVGVCAQVFLQHAGLLTPDATRLTDVLAPATAAHILVLLLTLEATLTQTQFVPLAVLAEDK